MYYRNFTHKCTENMSSADMSVGFMECDWLCWMELLKNGFRPGVTGLLIRRKGHFLKLACGTFTLPPVILGIFIQNMFAVGKF